MRGGFLPYTKTYCVKHPIVIMGHIYREIKWFFQRGARGWADRDVWSLDHYLAAWLPDALHYLRESDKGYPSGICDCKRDEYGVEKCDDNCIGPAKWSDILTAIANGFEASKIISENWIIRKEDSPEWQDFDKGMKLFHQYFFNLWD